MGRLAIITQLQQYFSIEELVCNHTFAKFGNMSWQFLDTELLETLLVLRRDIFGVPMTINHGAAHQRGLRCNICAIPYSKTIKGQLYLSAHCNGAGIDFDVQGLTAAESRKVIEQKQDLLPHRIRLEADVTWVHLDVYNNPNNSYQISYFNG